MSLAPLVLFVFNRPEHTRRTLESLQKNILASESDLLVFSDGAQNEVDAHKVDAVRRLINDFDGFRTITVHCKNSNRGLAGSVIDGVSDVIAKRERIIALEDDLLFSPYFLNYMNEALERYETDSRIFSIGGWSPPIALPEGYDEDSYLSYRCCTWGWATWRNRWGKVDWEVKDFESFVHDPTQVARFNRGGEDMTQILNMQLQGKISSWGIRWDYAHFRNNAYCFRPSRSIVGNTGNDGTGVHCGKTDKFDVAIDTRSQFRFTVPGSLALDEEINRRFATFYDGRVRSVMSHGQWSTPPRRTFGQRILSGIRRLVS
jgi:hypothetical protein